MRYLGNMIVYFVVFFSLMWVTFKFSHYFYNDNSKFSRFLNGIATPVHESAHFLVLLLARVPNLKFSLKRKVEADGSIEFGSVEYENNVNILQKIGVAISSIAPFLLVILVLFSIYSFCFKGIFVNKLDLIAFSDILPAVKSLFLGKKTILPITISIISFPVLFNIGNLSDNDLRVFRNNSVYLFSFLAITLGLAVLVLTFTDVVLWIFNFKFIGICLITLIVLYILAEILDSFVIKLFFLIALALFLSFYMTLIVNIFVIFTLFYIILTMIYIVIFKVIASLTSKKQTSSFSDEQDMNQQQ